MRCLPLMFCVVLACSGGRTATSVDADCDAMAASLDRDVCNGNRLKALKAADVDQAPVLAGKITDPMVRGEAVTTWVEAKANCIPPEKGQAMCNLLDGRDQSYCLRRLSAPHLQQDCAGQ